MFSVLHDSKQLLWQLFYHSAYEKKNKYSIDFTFELVSGGYYIHQEVERECVKSWVSRSDQEGWNVCNDGDWTVIKGIGRPILIDSGMLRNVKDIALGTRMTWWVINRRQLISIATGVVRANNPNVLKKYGGDLMLTEKRARGVLKKHMWSKCKGTTRKVDPYPQFLVEETFTFQRNISIGFWTRYPLIFDHQHRSNSRHMLIQGDSCLAWKVERTSS